MPVATLNLVAGSTNPASTLVYAKRIHDAMIAVGFVQTPDGGQIDFLASPPSMVTNTLWGYLVYELNDSLSPEAPIYVRIEVWTGTATNKMALTVQTGTGTDGSGNLTRAFGGVVAARSSSSTSSSASAHTIYISRGEGNFVIYAPAVGTSAGQWYYPLFYGLERARTLDGTYRKDALATLRIGSGAVVSESSAQWFYTYRYADGASFGNYFAGAITIPSIFSTQGIGGGVVLLFLPSLLWADGVDPWQPTFIAGVTPLDNPGTPFQVELSGQAVTFFGSGALSGSATYSPPVYIGASIVNFQSNAFVWRWEV